MDSSQDAIAMDAQDLNLAGFGLVITDFSLTRDLLALRLEAKSSLAACPRCGVYSHRVHGRYLRKLADLACHGRAVLIRLRVRRFRCTNGT